MHRRVTVTGTNIFFLILMSSFLILNTIAGIAGAVALGSSFKEYSDKLIYITTLINEYLLLLAPVLILALVKKVNFRQFFRLNALKPLHALFIVISAIPAYFAALMLNGFVIYVLQFIGDIPAQPIPVPKGPVELLIGIFVIGVTPAICEEALHRGLMLSTYEIRGTYRAVVITSLFFGFFHFDITNFFGTAFLGLIIGYYVVRTNSIFAGMLAHFLNNTFAELIQYFSGERTPAETITMSLSELGTMVVYGVAGLIILALLLTLFSKKTKSTAVITPPISKVRGDIVSVLSHWPVIVFLAIYAFVAFIYIVSIVLLRVV